MAIKPMRRKNKRLYLDIPISVWKMMREECNRRRAIEGSFVSLSRLVIQVMNEVLGPKHPEAKAHSAGD